VCVFVWSSLSESDERSSDSGEERDLLLDVLSALLSDLLLSLVLAVGVVSLNADEASLKKECNE
jgi:hypothetical protein